ncbi:hypothetical protein AAG906_025630 [Vitis piasezkii]
MEKPNHLSVAGGLEDFSGKFLWISGSLPYHHSSFLLDDFWASLTSLVWTIMATYCLLPSFSTIIELGELIETKQITSEELTQNFLHRLKRYNHVLEAVVTYTEELAYKQAKEADEMLAQGIYLGPLHGIPYGLKDIISVPQYKTTWGSKTFKDQVLNIEAWVYKSLFLDHWHMMTSGVEVGQGIHGILRNILLVDLLDLLLAPQQHEYVIMNSLDKSYMEHALLQLRIYFPSQAWFLLQLARKQLAP